MAPRWVRPQVFWAVQWALLLASSWRLGALLADHAYVRSLPARATRSPAALSRDSPALGGRRRGRRQPRPSPPAHRTNAGFTTGRWRSVSTPTTAATCWRLLHRHRRPATRRGAHLKTTIAGNRALLRDFHRVTSARRMDFSWQPADDRRRSTLLERIWSVVSSPERLRYWGASTCCVSESRWPRDRSRRCVAVLADYACSSSTLKPGTRLVCMTERPYNTGKRRPGSCSGAGDGRAHRCAAACLPHCVAVIRQRSLCCTQNFSGGSTRLPPPALGNIMNFARTLFRALERSKRFLLALAASWPATAAARGARGDAATEARPLMAKRLEGDDDAIPADCRRPRGALSLIARCQGRCAAHATAENTGGQLSISCRNYDGKPVKVPPSPAAAACSCEVSFAIGCQQAAVRRTAGRSTALPDGSNQLGSPSVEGRSR